MRLMQICTDFEAGGIQRHVLDLSDWLRERGHHVSFAGSRGAWMDESIDANFTEIPINKVSEDGGNIVQRVFEILRCALSLRKVLNNKNVDLIHVHETAPALVAKFASIFTKTPIVYTYHGSPPERVQEVGRIGRFSADLVITPSYRTADNLAEIGGVPRSKLQVIGLGVKPIPAVDSADVERLRDQLLGQEGKLLIVSIARLAPQKGIDILIEVVKRVLSVRQDIKFVVVGEGPLQGEVEKWTQEAGVNSHLKFVGRSDEVQRYLKASDLFLLTSRWEALPITIVEAFRAGLPVIATDTGGVAELVVSGTGRVVPVEDAEKLAQTVLTYCKDDRLRDDTSVAALKHSQEDRFSPPHIHQIFEDTYTRLLHPS